MNNAKLPPNWPRLLDYKYAESKMDKGHIKKLTFNGPI